MEITHRLWRYIRHMLFCQLAKWRTKKACGVIKPRSWSLGKQVSWWYISPSEKPKIWKLQQMEESWGMRGRMPQSNKRQQIQTPSSFLCHLDPYCIGWCSHTWARVDFWLFLFENFIHVCNIFWSNLPQVSPCQLLPCPPHHFSLLMSYTLNLKPNEAT